MAANSVAWDWGPVQTAMSRSVKSDGNSAEVVRHRVPLYFPNKRRRLAQISW